MVPPKRRLDLPLSPEWQTEDQYISELLAFATSSELFRHLCGGVHILDFLTSEPDLYTRVLPQDWREWFRDTDIWDILQYVLHRQEPPNTPPKSFSEYVTALQKLSLWRNFEASKREPPAMPRHISVGMKPKKMHEVSNFASFVNDLSTTVSDRIGEPVTLVDFGSGQNYLGRTLACPPYNREVIAIERKHHNVRGAQGMDVHAKLVKKEKVLRNKKEYKKRLAMLQGIPTPTSEELDGEPVEVPDHVLERLALNQVSEPGLDKGSMTYIEHDISDGNLEAVLQRPAPSSQTQIIATTRKTDSGPAALTHGRRLMTISLHSCGNLTHHAIRSLTLNASVSAVAIIGCCYNLLTERLGPASYKLPSLRPNHPRLIETGNAFDPHGFPMSKRLEHFPLPDGNHGVRLNITARMMAVQAPYNWEREDSEMFFTRHYYRALLQRLLLDRGVVKQASSPAHVVGGNSLTGKDEVGTPLIVGSLRKSCFTSFRAYVTAALEKLGCDEKDGSLLREKTMNLSGEIIDGYETRYAYAKKNLSVIWTLMAFSAGVVESIIAVDRWLWLKEQECVKEAWVQTVFEYGLSPRNLCVVGTKKQGYTEKAKGK